MRMRCAILTIAYFISSIYAENTFYPRLCGSPGHRSIKMGFKTSLAGENPRRFLFLEPNALIIRMIAWLFLKKQIFPRFLAYHPLWSRFFPRRPPMMNPRPAPIGSGVPEGRQRPHAHPTSGMVRNFWPRLIPKLARRRRRVNGKKLQKPTQV